MHPMYIYLIMFLLLRKKKFFHYFLMHIHTNLFPFYFSPSSWSWWPLAGLDVSATTFIFHTRPLVIWGAPYNSLSLASFLHFQVLIFISITITTHNLKLMWHSFFCPSFYVLLQVLNRTTNGEAVYNFVSRLTRGKLHSLYTWSHRKRVHGSVCPNWKERYVANMFIFRPSVL
jgi:hypothetical protein